MGSNIAANEYSAERVYKVSIETGDESAVSEWQTIASAIHRLRLSSDAFVVLSASPSVGPAEFMQATTIEKSVKAGLFKKAKQTLIHVEAKLDEPDGRRVIYAYETPDEAEALSLFRDFYNGKAPDCSSWTEWLVL